MTEPINDGGPAHPVECYFGTDNPEGKIRGLQTGNHSGWETGMSLRDYFAGQALANRSGGDYDSFAEMADDCYRIADAMLKERSK